MYPLMVDQVLDPPLDQISSTPTDELLDLPLHLFV